MCGPYSTHRHNVLPDGSCVRRERTDVITKLVEVKWLKQLMNVTELQVTVIPLSLTMSGHSPPNLTRPGQAHPTPLHILGS